MPARLVVVIRWIALLLLVLAIALIVVRWKLPSTARGQERGASVLDTLRTLWIRWSQRRHEAREQARDIEALKRKRILLVGAEDKYMRAVRWWLESLGCTIDRARTGTQALSLARERRPAAVVVDSLLPDMSVLDFCGLFEDKHTPIALIGVSSQYRRDLDKLGSQVVCASDEVEPEKLIGQLGRMIRSVNCETVETPRARNAAL